MFYVLALLTLNVLLPGEEKTPIQMQVEKSQLKEKLEVYIKKVFLHFLHIMAQTGNFKGTKIVPPFPPAKRLSTSIFSSFSYNIN